MRPQCQRRGRLPMAITYALAIAGLAACSATGGRAGSATSPTAAGVATTSIAATVTTLVGDQVPPPVSDAGEPRSEGGDAVFQFDQDPLGGGRQIDDFGQVRSAAEAEAKQVGYRLTILDPTVLGLAMQYYLSNSSLAAVSKGMTVIESVGAWSPGLADDMAKRANDSSGSTGTVAVRVSVAGGTMECVYLSGVGSSELLCGSGGVITQIVRPPVADEGQQKEDLAFEVALMEKLAAAPIVLNADGKPLT